MRKLTARLSTQSVFLAVFSLGILRRPSVPIRVRASELVGGTAVPRRPVERTRV
jgi:hypothetical protein